MSEPEQPPATTPPMAVAAVDTMTFMCARTSHVAARRMASRRGATVRPRAQDQVVGWLGRYRPRVGVICRGLDEDPSGPVLTGRRGFLFVGEVREHPIGARSCSTSRTPDPLRGLPRPNAATAA